MEEYHEAYKLPKKYFMDKQSKFSLSKKKKYIYKTIKAKSYEILT